MTNTVEWLDARIARRSLLKHPFYQAWQCGELTRDDLQEYAIQYYHFESHLPRFLSGIHYNCGWEDVRKIVLENLWDEEHGEENHRVLWLNFCQSIGVDMDRLILTKQYKETASLIAVYLDMCSHKNRIIEGGLAAIYVYEKQVPAIAKAKMEGLRQFYGITDEKSLQFFVVHSELDNVHALREAEALSAHVLPDGLQWYIEVGAYRALDAWWGFLDGIENRRAGRK